jgi:hypothetical protein
MPSAAGSWRTAPRQPRPRRSYLETASSWEQLAAEIEGAQAFIKTMAEIVGRSESDLAEPEAA